MKTIGEALFFGCLAAVLYAYSGYPLAVLLLSKIKSRQVAKDNRLPFVSLVIAARNEEECIGQTIENKLRLDYPAEKREILVISDASSTGPMKSFGPMPNRESG